MTGSRWISSGTPTMVLFVTALLGMKCANAEQDPILILERLEERNRGYVHAKAAESARQRARAYQYGIAGPTAAGSVGPNALSDAEVVRGEYDLELNRQRECVRLAMVLPGGQTQTTYARRGLGCKGVRFE